MPSDYRPDVGWGRLSLWVLAVPTANGTAMDWLGEEAGSRMWQKLSGLEKLLTSLRDSPETASARQLQQAGKVELRRFDFHATLHYRNVDDNM